MQVRYEVDGDAEQNLEQSIHFYQKLARQGLIATEQIGRPDPKTGKTPVTVQLIIPKEDFDPLNGKATAKNPITPFATDRTNNHLIPEHLNSFINGYLAERIKIGGKNIIDRQSIRISVNELPATTVRQAVTEYNGVTISLNGDASLGLSYFKGLNAGLEATANYFTKMKTVIQQDLTDNIQVRAALSDYQKWFSTFATKKVKEVQQYSVVRVQSGMKVVKMTHQLKLASAYEPQPEPKPVIDTYYRLLTKATQGEQVIFEPFPHREYDPNILLGQFKYIPISWTLKKIGKLFIDYFKPYKGTYQLVQDFKQPMVGLVNVGSGLVKIIVGLFTLNTPRFGDGFFSLCRGVLELATTPLAWVLKPITRGIATLIVGPHKIEKNHGIQELVKIGEALLLDQNDDDFSFVKTKKLLGICNDLHRKFDKSIKREQQTDIAPDIEAMKLAQLTSNESEPLTRQKIRDYFTLFGGKSVNECSNFADEKDLSGPTLIFGMGTDDPMTYKRTK